MDDKEFEDYRNMMFDLFLQPGWKQFIEDCQGAADRIKVENISSTEEFWKCKGEKEQLNRIINLEEMLRAI